MPLTTPSAATRAVHALSFDYAQRHRVELDCAAAIAAQAGVEHTILPIEAFARLADASLTNPAIESLADATGTGNTYAERRGLPSSFVPGRNIIFLGLAAAFGIPRGMETLVAGVCSTDEAGYPDCRADFVASLEDTIRIGMDCAEFGIDAPLLHRTKARDVGDGGRARACSSSCEPRPTPATRASEASSTTGATAAATAPPAKRGRAAGPGSTRRGSAAVPPVRRQAGRGVLVDRQRRIERVALRLPGRQGPAVAAHELPERLQLIGAHMGEIAVEPTGREPREHAVDLVARQAPPPDRPSALAVEGLIEAVRELGRCGGGAAARPGARRRRRGLRHRPSSRASEAGLSGRCAAGRSAQSLGARRTWRRRDRSASHPPQRCCRVHAHPCTPVIGAWRPFLRTVLVASRVAAAGSRRAPVLARLPGAGPAARS